MSISVDKQKLYIVFPLSGTTVASANIPATAQPGWIKDIYFVSPTFSAATVSGTITITDDDGVTLWSFGTGGLSSALATAHHLTAADIPLAPGYSFVWTLGAIPGSAAGLSATPLTANIVVWIAP